MFALKKFCGYVLGFVLFYAPFAVVQRLIYSVFDVHVDNATIHSACFRVQIEHLLDGKFYLLPMSFAVFLVLLLGITLFFGPIFCGKLCPAGAFTEYISRLLPDKFKIRWSNYIDITPVRYGMLFGFIILPFFNGVLACSYCNFFVFDLLINYYSAGYYVAFSSSLLITLLLWLMLFGLFTKGGRGYCNFLCPVGAIQNLIYYCGNKLNISYQLKIDKNKCIGCKRCEKACPMDSIKFVEQKIEHNIHNCILCGECIEKCPTKAIIYIKERITDEK